MRKGIVSFAGMVLALVLLVCAFFGPWYTINASGIFGASYNVGLFLTRMEVQGSFSGQNVSLSMGYSEAKVKAQNIDVNVESFTVIDTALYLTFFAIITTLVALICMAAFVFNKGKPRTMKLLGGLFGFLTFLLTLIPALYFMSTGFVQNSSSFWFTQSVLSMKLLGGPGYAWYLMMVVAVISVICAVAILLKKIVPEGVVSEGISGEPK
jgi:hypothetical protein